MIVFLIVFAVALAALLGSQAFWAAQKENERVRRVIGFTKRNQYVWNLEEPVTIPPGESRTFIVDMAKPPDEAREVWAWTAWGLRG